MRKIQLIIVREFLTRVKKKSFILMTFLGPVLLAALFLLPPWVMMMQGEEEKRIAVFDPNDTLQDIVHDKEAMKFVFFKQSYDKDKALSLMSDSGYYATMYLPSATSSLEETVLTSKKQPSMSTVEYINNSLEDIIRKQKLQAQGLDQAFMDSLETHVEIATRLMTDEGKEKVSSSKVFFFAGLITAFLIYMMIFTYGGLVMRGVIEEKTSRIIEIIISSVKPFQLLMGKIIGIAGVFLLQMLLWVVLTGAIVVGVQSAFMGDMIDQDALNSSMMGGQSAQVEQMQDIAQDSSQLEQIYLTLANIPWGRFIGTFIFFFLGGYLMYSSLFAAIGGAVDNETDTQQFMLPITIPLILAIVLIAPIVENPDGSLALWTSMIPFTSPIIMTARVLFGVSNAELFTSMGILVVSFLAATWVGAKIYRTGILMYGKKPTYKDLWRWLKA